MANEKAKICNDCFYYDEAYSFTNGKGKYFGLCSWGKAIRQYKLSYKKICNDFQAIS